ncbi:MAG: pilus assembly protein TadG-related protein [Novosphingobium sp.]
MLGTIRRVFSDLKRNSSGNAMLLVALGTPVLIGTSGLAVDSAQYYMWKRDLQYAVDQAALAGAWARTTTATQSSYQSRATQEYNANIQNTADFDGSGATTQLGNWNATTNTFTASGTGTAVKVTASATKRLPFTNIITGRSVTVSVSAVATASQAGTTVTTTTTYNTLTACMIALNPTAYGAFTIGGNATGSVGCGGAALSTDPSAAIRENGNPDATFGQLVAGGGIEYSLLNNVGGDPLKLKSNTVGMVDPLGTLNTPAGNGITRAYSCPAVTAGTPTVYTATQLLRTKITYTYKKGKFAASATPITYTSGTGYLADSDDNPGVTTTVSRTSGPYTASGPTQVGPTAGTPIAVAGNNSNTIWRTATTTTWTTISSPGSTPGIPANDGTAKPLPGTYTDINIACKTQFQPGIYVINGTIDFSQNQTITGSNVLFVMTNANRIQNINSNTNIALSGITASLLMSDYGYTPTDAAKLAGMLFFDKNSTDQIKFNGNSTTNFNGIIYMPHRMLWFNGTSAVSGACMMLVADKLMLDGTTDMSSFCQPSNANSMEVRPQMTTTTTTPGTTASVKLVG